MIALHKRYITDVSGTENEYTDVYTIKEDETVKELVKRIGLSDNGDWVGNGRIIIKLDKTMDVGGKT